MIVACVRSGTKYGVDYVYKLKSMVSRHLSDFRFVCLTDRPGELNGVDTIPIPSLPRWWGKMCLFDPHWRNDRVLYLDLDTIICDDLTPLTRVTEFSTCENFTRLAGYDQWQCKYGSCVMIIPQDWGEFIWKHFSDRMASLIKQYEKYGDQKLIEDLVPNALFLQRLMPQGFFVHYRFFGPKIPPRASIMVFAGPRKPHNTTYKWVKDHWR